jgi:hypothetical protein
MSTLTPEARVTAKYPGVALTDAVSNDTRLSFFGYLHPSIESFAQLAYGKRGKLPKEGEPPVPESWSDEKPVMFAPSKVKPPWLDSEFVSATAFAIP